MEADALDSQFGQRSLLMISPHRTGRGIQIDRQQKTWLLSHETIRCRTEISSLLPPQGIEEWCLGVLLRTTDLGSQAWLSRQG
jgi:hypothetical protein